MAEGDDDSGRTGLTRRELIKRAAIVGGAAVWAAPVIRMAVGSGDDNQTVNIDGAQLATFIGPCSAVLLTPVSTTRTICATTLAKAKSAFTSAVTTECNTKCTQHGPCTSPPTCKTKKSGGTSVGVITCTGPGPNCPSPPYASNTKQWICSAVVTCNCVCR